MIYSSLNASIGFTTVAMCAGIKPINVPNTINPDIFSNLGSKISAPAVMSNQGLPSYNLQGNNMILSDYSNNLTLYGVGYYAAEYRERADVEKILNEINTVHQVTFGGHQHAPHVLEGQACFIRFYSPYNVPR